MHLLRFFSEELGNTFSYLTWKNPFPYFCLQIEVMGIWKNDPPQFFEQWHSVIVGTFPNSGTAPIDAAFAAAAAAAKHSYPCHWCLSNSSNATFTLDTNFRGLECWTLFLIHVHKRFFTSKVRILEILGWQLRIFNVMNSMFYNFHYFNQDYYDY